MNRTNLSRARALATSFMIPLSAFAWSGCGQGDSASSSIDSTESLSEIATAAVSGSANTSSVGAMAYEAPAARGALERLLSELSPVQSALASHNTCPLPNTGVSGVNCSVDGTGQVMSLTYSSCDYGNRSAVWNGGEVLISSAPVSCGAFPSEASGATLRRSFAQGTTRTIGNSVHVTTIDTTEPSGYEASVAGGTLITYGASGSRTIQIDGIHLTAKKVFRGNGNSETPRVAWDHSISTDPTHPLSVTASGSTHVVNGTVVVQHNLAKYTGHATFTDVTFSAGCCYPKSGSVTTVLTGSKSGTETLSFSGSDCGSAKLKDEKGSQSSFTLIHCL